MEIFLSSAYAPFTAALAVVAVLGVVELVLLVTSGLGLSDMLEWMLHTDSFPETAWTNWLIVRGLPLSVATILLLAFFGSSGFAIQSVSNELQGSTLPLAAVVIASLVVGWIGLRFAGRVLAPLFGTNTTAVSLDTLIGKKASILSPHCRADLLAEVQVTDAHGSVHVLMVTPAEGQPDFVQGDEVVLHERAGHGFTVRKA